MPQASVAVCVCVCGRGVLVTVARLARGESCVGHSVANQMGVSVCVCVCVCVCARACGVCVCVLCATRRGRVQTWVAGIVVAAKHLRLM